MARGFWFHSRSPLIREALRRAIKRAAIWGTDSSLRVQDIHEYIMWQIQPVSEGLEWYYGMHWLAIAIKEGTVPLVEMETVDRMEKEVKEHTVVG
jgi:hypothetical protein